MIIEACSRVCFVVSKDTPLDHHSHVLVAIQDQYPHTTSQSIPNLRREHRSNAWVWIYPQEILFSVILKFAVLKWPLEKGILAVEGTISDGDIHHSI